MRRARREDVPPLAEHAGGSPAGRFRALRRLLKTLVADVYVIDRDGSIDGVVAVAYRRSFSRGGLVATIDAMLSMRTDPADVGEDLALLFDCALGRARRRGCIGIDGAFTSGEARQTLVANGFEAGPSWLGRSLRPEEDEG